MFGAALRLLIGNAGDHIDEVSRVERGWHSVPWSDRIRNFGWVLGSKLSKPRLDNLSRDHGGDSRLGWLPDRAYRLRS